MVVEKHPSLVFLGKLYQNRVDMSETITTRSFLSFLIQMANYWAEICHLLIKFNSNFFLSDTRGRQIINFCKS